MIPPLRNRSMSGGESGNLPRVLFSLSVLHPRRPPSSLRLVVSLSRGSLFPPRGGRTGAGSDTANRRTATDNDAAKCASVVPRPSPPRWSTRADKLSGYPREQASERASDRTRSHRSGNPRGASTLRRVHVSTLPRALLAYPSVAILSVDSAVNDPTRFFPDFRADVPQ